MPTVVESWGRVLLARNIDTCNVIVEILIGISFILRERAYSQHILHS